MKGITMAILYKAAIQERKRKSLIEQLENAGIKEHLNKSIYEQEYRTLRYLIRLHKIQNEV
jgi:hypothetical protein